jgi:acyl-CoA synthetase (AMP-forming)/AMP-acid ligase II
MQLSPTVQRLRAILVPATPHTEISIADVRQFTQQYLSRYKVPRVFEVRQSLPTSPAGKVLRRMVEVS